MSAVIEPLDKLTRDLKAAAGTLTIDEARYLVDQYYVLQDARIRADGQIRSMSKVGEPHEVLVWLGGNAAKLETNIKGALESFAMSRRSGRWLMSLYGIGPVIAAGLLAHLDVRRWRCRGASTEPRCTEAAPHEGKACAVLTVPTAGGFWRFAGLDPTQTWEKGQKRPWNAALKVLCWKAGESFKKFSNREECFYGQVYRERKLLEVGRNDSGTFAETAKATLAAKNWRRDTKTRAAYESGKLPDGRLDLRASRYAVKLLLSHLHQVMWEDRFGERPPQPYAVAVLGHAHLIDPPGWPTQ